MTFEEIKAKIEACASVSITEIKEIQYGKCICLSNGGKINCFNTGKYTVQGKAQDQIKAILEGTSKQNNRKIFVVYGHDEIARTQLEAFATPVGPGAHYSGSTGIWRPNDYRKA